MAPLDDLGRDYGERHSTLHPEVWQALRASPLPAAALPLPFGGLQWPAGQIIDAVRQLALAAPSAGWAEAIHAPAGAFTARLDTQTAAELGLGPGKPPPLIAGSSIPAGTAEPAQEHVRLRGTWPPVTSAPQMTLAVLAAPDPEDHATRWWWVAQDNVHVLQDWDAVGLRGGASCSVTCDTLVPPRPHRPPHRARRVRRTALPLLPVRADGRLHRRRRPGHTRQSTEPPYIAAAPAPTGPKLGVLRAVPQSLAGARRQLRHLAALSERPHTSGMRMSLRLAMHRIRRRALIHHGLRDNP
ncbi:hypothetical protein ACIOHC_41565 [Streptomyces sp. NPDC088252]|uniref:hypothetical protein n=1 Tax=unclassified Streptomyces TaxID=2593676 RepID=UPI003805A086